ncbi:hypothetical protein HJA89_29780 [Rhizobium bangladeshense]|uniref:hypothetical protein n=1 Tax=Rhizobium bangladeshense TaxID=1138189 RepID=UPI001C839283|nr:hypothetical protein [Rhizobium bangladeshense]MBX4876989.1 hypothetical protein [Rhizobium bangladeshense]
MKEPLQHPIGLLLTETVAFSPVNAEHGHHSLTQLQCRNRTLWNMDVYGLYQCLDRHSCVVPGIRRRFHLPRALNASTAEHAARVADPHRLTDDGIHFSRPRMTLPIDSQTGDTARTTDNRNFQDLPVDPDPALADQAAGRSQPPAGQEHAIGVIAFSKEKIR